MLTSPIFLGCSLTCVLCGQYDHILRVLQDKTENLTLAKYKNKQSTLLRHNPDLFEGITMQKCYEAIYDHGKAEFLGVSPNCQYAQIIVVTGDDDDLTEFHNTVNALNLPDDVNVFSLLRLMSPEQLLNLAKNCDDSVDWKSLQQKDQ